MSAVIAYHRDCSLACWDNPSVLLRIVHCASAVHSEQGHGLCGMQAPLQPGHIQPRGGPTDHRLDAHHLLYTLQAVPVRLHQQASLISNNSRLSATNRAACFESQLLRGQSWAEALTTRKLARCRITMNVTAYHPSDCVELPPSLPPLVEAVTDEQHTRNEQEARIQVGLVTMLRPVCICCSIDM